MKEIVEKLRRLEMRISRERGPVNFFGWFLRDNGADRWDLMLAAPWADSDHRAVRKYVVDQIPKELSPSEMVYIAQVVVLPNDMEDLEELYEEHSVEHGKVIMRNFDFGLQSVRKAYIITCRAPMKQAA